MSEECPFHLKTVSKMEPLEYRSVIKFLNMQGKSPSVIFEEMFSVYQEECPSYETVKYWVIKFKSGFLSIHDSPREGRPNFVVTEDSVCQVKTLVLEDHLHMSKVSARWVLRLLTPNQKEQRADSSMIAVHTSMQRGFKILPHPPYSPDLAPSDFFIFPSLKKHQKGQRFHSNEDVISAVEEWFESHPKSYYAQGLLKVKESWQKCVDMQGDYVEK